MILDDLQSILSLLEIARDDTMVTSNFELYTDLTAAIYNVNEAIIKAMETKVDE